MREHLIITVYNKQSFSSITDGDSLVTNNKSQRLEVFAQIRDAVRAFKIVFKNSLGKFYQIDFN